MRGTSSDGEEDVFTEHVIDLFAGEQLSALFRAGGDVIADIPALRDEYNQNVASGPINMARCLSERFASLFPANETESIQDHIARLNGLDWFSLSLPVPQSTGQIDEVSGAAIKMLQDDIERKLTEGASAWYRAALMYRVRTLESDSDETARVYQVRRQAKEVLESIEGTLNTSSSYPWAFGLKEPSELDAHLVPSLARLRDAGNEALMPSTLSRYLDVAMRTRYWREVMADRATLR